MVGTVFGNVFAYIILDVMEVVVVALIIDFRMFMVTLMAGMEVCRFSLSVLAVMSFVLLNSSFCSYR